MSTHADLALRDIDPASRSAVPASRNRRFYFGMAATMSVAVFLGFGPSFYLNVYLAETLGLQPLRTLSPVIVVHGLVFTAWMIVLMVQTGLVAKGQVRWHRRLGVAGAVLAALVFALGMTANVASSHRAVISGDFYRLPFIPFVVFGGFVSLIVFAVLVTLAIQWRRRPETHKRLMLLATIALLGAATARIAAYLGTLVPAIAQLPFLGLVLTDVFLIALVVHDWRAARRLHPATLYGGLAVLLMQALSNSPLPVNPAVKQLMVWLTG